MARAKKASRKRYRRFNYSRWYRRRRYRRRYSKRSGRRFPKGTEVKSKSADVSGTISPSFVEVSSKTYMSYPYGRYISIGGSTDNFNIPLPQGTGQGQRIGAKVEPIKLRISGTVQVDDTTLGNTAVPNFWQVRCVIYQVKGANSSVEPNRDGYHQLSMQGENGTCTGADIGRLLCQFSFDTTNGVDIDQWRKNNFLAKCPMRRGIGGLCRVLYKKSFWVNSQKNPIKQFRFITKVPKRLVYPETRYTNDGDAIANSCSNAIFVVFMFQPGSFQQECIPDLHYSYHCDLFYTDK